MGIHHDRNLNVSLVTEELERWWTAQGGPNHLRASLICTSLGMVALPADKSLNSRFSWG